MKLNWGYKIAIVYIAFAVMVLAMVAFFMHKDVDLITNKYYDDELKYQQRINSIKRTQTLEDDIKIEVQKGFVILKYPKSLNKRISGEILFYRPSEIGKDLHMVISADSLNQQLISTVNIMRGVWKVQVNWKADDQDYYSEKELAIN